MPLPFLAILSLLFCLVLPPFATAYELAQYGSADFSSGAAPLSVGNGTIGSGSTIYNTYAGDPVNMVTGNVYHTERDLSLKGRGGLPLVFERSYNSRNPQDGPLGFGWTHSFNHYLTFKDDNYNGTTEAADTDNTTSAVSWTDGTGSEKFMQVTGNSGGIPIGSTFTPPKGFFFQMARAANGTYTIREKNGLTYTFENVAGTVNQKARLTSITDRNNNTLTLTYPAGQVVVTDVEIGGHWKSGDIMQLKAAPKMSIMPPEFPEF